MPLSVDIVTRVPNVHWDDKWPGIVFFVFHDLDYSPEVSVAVTGSSQWLMAKAGPSPQADPTLFGIFTYIGINLLSFNPGVTKITVSCPGSGPISQDFQSIIHTTNAIGAFNFTTSTNYPTIAWPIGTAGETREGLLATAHGVGPRHSSPPTDDIRWVVLQGTSDTAYVPIVWEPHGEPIIGGKSLIGVQAAYNDKITHSNPDWPTDDSQPMDDSGPVGHTDDNSFEIPWAFFNNFQSEGKADPHPPTNFPGSDNQNTGLDLIYTLPVDWENRPGIDGEEGPPEEGSA